MIEAEVLVIRWVVSLLAAVSLLILLGTVLFSPKKAGNMKDLKVYVPFVFSEEIDPRAVYTVGDQIVSEHVFAFHNSASIKQSALPLFSKVKIDQKYNTVEIEPTRDVIDNTGTKLSFDQICASVKSSFSGTQHTRYSSLVESINCEGRKIKVKMSTVPVNLEYWLRSTDFAIYSPENLPLKNSSLQPTTGPYTIVSISPSEVKLKANPFFPEDLTANRVESVHLKSYSPGDIETLPDFEDLHLAYLYGYSISHDVIAKLKTRGFKVQIFPNEWLMYLGFQKSVDLETRNAVAAKIDDIRASFEDKMVYGTPAYSTIPTDRAYGLTEEDYTKNKNPIHSKLPLRKLRFSTLEEWAQIPLFSFVIEELKKDMDIEIKLFARKDMQKVYSPDESDFYLSPMGVSAADPLGNYSFFLAYEELFKNVLSEELLVSLYKEHDFQRFSQKVKEIELKLLKERIFVPIGHFPGIVIESSEVIRDEAKSWDWGIQAWAYKII